MITKSVVQRIVFFIVITVSYFSYRVINQVFYEERKLNEERDLESVASLKIKKSLPFQHFDDGSPEAPYSLALENIIIQSNNNPSGVVGYYQKQRKTSKIDVHQKNIYVTHSGKRSRAKSSGRAGTTNAAPDDYATANSGNGVGSAGSGGGDAGIASSGGGSDDLTIIDNVGGMSIPLFITTTTETGLGGAASGVNGGFARIGISTTPSVGGSTNSTTQAAPPPPPPNPVPLDSNSIIFIAMGATLGVFVLLKDSKKRSQVV